MGHFSQMVTMDFFLKEVNESPSNPTADTVVQCVHIPHTDGYPPVTNVTGSRNTPSFAEFRHLRHYVSWNFWTRLLDCILFHVVLQLIRGVVTTKLNRDIH